MTSPSSSPPLHLLQQEQQQQDMNIMKHDNITVVPAAQAVDNRLEKQESTTPSTPPLLKANPELSPKQPGAAAKHKEVTAGGVAPSEVRGVSTSEVSSSTAAAAAAVDTATTQTIAKEESASSSSITSAAAMSPPQQQTSPMTTTLPSTPSSGSPASLSKATTKKMFFGRKRELEQLTYLYRDCCCCRNNNNNVVQHHPYHNNQCISNNNNTSSSRQQQQQQQRRSLLLLNNKSSNTFSSSFYTAAQNSFSQNNNNNTEFGSCGGAGWEKSSAFFVSPAAATKPGCHRTLQQPTATHSTASTTTPHAILLEASSGAGKTALLDEFCEQLLQQNQSQPQPPSIQNQRQTVLPTIAPLICRGEFQERAAYSSVCGFSPVVTALSSLIHSLLTTTSTTNATSNHSNSNSNLSASTTTPTNTINNINFNNLSLIWKKRFIEELEDAELTFLEEIIPSLKSLASLRRLQLLQKTIEAASTTTRGGASLSASTAVSTLATTTSPASVVALKNIKSNSAAADDYSEITSISHNGGGGGGWCESSISSSFSPPPHHRPLRASSSTAASSCSSLRSQQQQLSQQQLSQLQLHQRALFPTPEGGLQTEVLVEEQQEQQHYFDGFGNKPGDNEKEWRRFERFRLAIRSVVRCLSRYHPLVLIMDNLQWAEADSMALLQTLICDDAVLLLQQQQQSQQQTQSPTTPQQQQCQFFFVGATRTPPQNKTSAATTSATTTTTRNKCCDNSNCCCCSNNPPNDCCCTSPAAPASCSSACCFKCCASSPSSSHHSQEHRYELIRKLKRETHDYQLAVLSLPDWTVDDIEELLIQHCCSTCITVDDKVHDEGNNDNWLNNKDELKRLSHLILEKTGGNCFVVLHYLRLLDQKQLLFYDEPQKKWVCHIEAVAADEINLSGNSSGNGEAAVNGGGGGGRSNGCIGEDVVTKVVAGELQTMVQKKRKSAMIAAASFGASQFDVETIVHAMHLFKACNNDDGDNAMSFLPCGGRTSNPKGGGDLSESNHQGACVDFVGSAASSYYLDETEADEEISDPFTVRANIRIMNEILSLSAKENNFILEVAPGQFRFVHDRVREAAYSLLPRGMSKQKVHLKIGRQLRQFMDVKAELGEKYEEEPLLLNATDQLNLGADLIHDLWEKIDLAELNYQAAEHAAKNFSFHPAIEYLETGIKLLGHEMWADHYDLAIKLTVTLTRIQYCCGLFEQCLRVATNMVENAKTFGDKRPVYHTMLSCLIQSGRMDEATSLALTILSELGQTCPKRFLRTHGIIDHKKAVRKLKKFADFDLMNLPEVDDEILNDSIDFMERLAEIALLVCDPAYFHLFETRLTSITLDHGRLPRAPYSFCYWAWARASAGKHDEALHFAQLSLKCCEQGRSKIADSRAQMVVYYFVYHWRMPLRDVLAPVSNAFRDLWLCGALDVSQMDGCVLLRLSFACGESLNDLAKDCKKFSEMLIDYKQSLHWNINCPLFQAVLNLRGESEDPTILSGEYMEEEDRIAHWIDTGNKNAIFQYQFFVMVLATLFRKYKLAESVISKMQPLYDAGPDVFVPCRVFFSGLAYLSLAFGGAGQLCKYRRKGCKALRQLRKWSEAGAVSCNHMYLLLEAENLRLSSTNVQTVQRAYDKAIAAAGDAGLLHYNALANERAGCYLAAQSGKSFVATPYISRALSLYHEWGATAKVRDIQSRYPELSRPVSDFWSSNCNPSVLDYSSLTA